jgi:hypothetical protein
MNNITEHPKQLLDERMHCSSTIPSQNGVFNKQTECISNLNRTVKQPMMLCYIIHCHPGFNFLRSFIYISAS